MNVTRNKLFRVRINLMSVHGVCCLDIGFCHMPFALDRAIRIVAYAVWPWRGNDCDIKLSIL